MSSSWKPDDFLGSPSNGGRTKIKAAKIGKKLESEASRPEVWVCREQDPQPECLRKKSWTAIRTIHKSGCIDQEFGKDY